MNATNEPVRDAIECFAYLHRSGNRWNLRIVGAPEWVSSDILTSLDKQGLPIALICQYDDKALALELKSEQPAAFSDALTEFKSNLKVIIEPKTPPPPLPIPPVSPGKPSGLELLAVSKHKDAIIANVMRIATNEKQSPVPYIMQALGIDREEANDLRDTILDNGLSERRAEYSEKVNFTEAQVAIKGEKPKSQRAKRKPMSEEAKSKASLAQKARWERVRAEKAGGAE